ncbi:aldo/keto reductase [Streptomyces sp. SPB074]|uniref:aldo/keto reductase n=1 Tax=Streptomyces sp. (strain SPB074) TaxID=465543 RepID=UPI0001D1E357|nr:aldo/keto reductase [Streptomyces sp. SPB074]EDY43387.2 pyridoxal 4-dehydrogenase [Streptomyces sp. SPB074]
MIPTAPLGRAGLPVTRLGFGAAPVAGLYAPLAEDAAQRTLAAAWEAGIRYFDTAPHYGVGLSEERLGRFLAGRPREAYVLSTKVGRRLVPHPGPAREVDGADGFFGTPARERVRDYSADGVRRSLAESLERLGLDRVDVVLIHDPEAYAREALEEAYPALERLRAEGVVSSIGVGMNETALPARFVRETDIDVVLVAGRHTLLDGEAAHDLLPLCRARGVDVIAAGAFNSGLLADPAAPGARYDYGRAPAPLLARARRIAAVCARHDVPLPVAALAHTAAHPAVRTVLAGMRTPREVRENTRAFTTPVPAALWADLAEEGLLPQAEATEGDPR